MNYFKLNFPLVLISTCLFLSQLSLGQRPMSFLSEDTTSKNRAEDIPFGQTVYAIESIATGQQDLSQYVQILKEKNVQLKPEDIKRPEWIKAFKSLPADSLNCARCAYWGKISIKNNTKQRLNQWILYLGQAGTIDAFIFNGRDSLVSTQKTGRFVAASQKPLHNGNRLNRIVLSFEDNELLNIFFRIENTNGYIPVVNVTLSAEDFYKSGSYTRQRILDGLFLGFLLSLIVFNLIFYITTRDVAFFYQFLFVSSVLVFMMDIMNLICDFPILRDHPRFFEPINFASLVLLNISYLYFVNKFIEVEKIFPKWIIIIDRLVQVNLVLGSFIIIFYFISLNERITDTAIALVSTLQYATLLILLFQFLRIRDKKSYFILIATFFLIGGVIVDGICIALEIGVPINFSKIIVLGNLSFFFFGLAFRMKLLKEEEHEAIRLKENQELKNKLYANITHEFRTPLTVIQGMAQQMESSVKMKEPALIHQAIQLIKSNCNRLLKLVNTILDLAKLESGKMELNLVRGDIISYLRYVVQLFESYADTKKIKLRFLTELEVMEMDFDKEKIQQIVSNLISNAIKFTPPEGKILFTVKKLEKDTQPILQLEIKDTGVGIHKAELGNIFNRFFQADSSMHKAQGSGLGLALVYEMVKLMDGRLEVESEPGEGTTFKILLPVRSYSNNLIRVAGLENEGQVLEDYITGEMSRSADIESPRLNNESGSRQAGVVEINNEKPLLLIVDDNKDIIYYLQSFLEPHYILETAYTGKDGIALALEIIPDIILSDVLMPDKNGYELCEILKGDERTSHIPIILLTAKTTQADRIEGLRKGADAYLSKPFDELELLVQLDNLLHLRKSLQQRYTILETQPLLHSEPRPVEDAFLSRLNVLIREHLDDEDFGILQLCRSMQVSRTQLHRKITALTGKSTSIYLRFLRLQQAKVLLKQPEKNISEVAFAVGFSDPNYFTRTFTEEFGITPSGFRAGI